MGSYGVIKEALLVKKNDSSDEYSVVQKLVPATVNGMVNHNDGNGGFEIRGKGVSIRSIYHGGAFGFSESSTTGKVSVSVNIPGYGVKFFTGFSSISNVNGVGDCVICEPAFPDPSTPYTHLCLVVEAPGSVFV